jgi:catechol 2,3-dioxygenase-like lactoylglutathione lyase family enzyme
MQLVTSVSHINRTVRDLDETIDFYTQNLGFYLLRRYMRNGREAAYIGLGDVLFELGVDKDTPDLGSDLATRIGLTVTDLDALLADLRAKGVEVVTEADVMRTFWGRQATIRDPNGYIISLREWQAPDGPHFADWQPRHEGVTRLA